MENAFCISFSSLSGERSPPRAINPSVQLRKEAEILALRKEIYRHQACDYFPTTTIWNVPGATFLRLFSIVTSAEDM